MQTAKIFSTLGAVGLIVGALLPWMVAQSAFGSIGTIDYLGGAVVNAIIGAIIFAIVFFVHGTPGRIYSLVVVILAVIAAIAMVGDFAITSSNVRAESAGQDVAISVGPGFIVSAIGILFAFFGGLSHVHEDTLL